MTQPVHESHLLELLPGVHHGRAASKLPCHLAGGGRRQRVLDDAGRRGGTQGRKKGLSQPRTLSEAHPAKVGGAGGGEGRLDLQEVWCGCGVGVVWVWCGCGVGVV